MASWVQLLSLLFTICIEASVVYLCSIEFSKIYMSYANVTLTLRQRAFVLSMYSSGVLCIVGLYFNSILYYNSFDIKQYITNFTLYDFALSKISIHMFTGYLIMDLSIGMRDYRSYINSLTGYVHHIVYIFVNILSLYTGLYPLYCIFMIAEIPTFILSAGSVYPRYRSDISFGITFALTRIVYFTFIIYILRQFNVIVYFAIPILFLHVYWFYRFVIRQLKTCI